MQEVWKDIEGYEGLYQISNLGRVKSLKRIYYCGIKNKTKKVIEEYYVKEYISNNGYKRVVLSKNGYLKKYLVHRLVAITFISNPNNFSQINHKDENKENNRVDNLEWCSHKYNINYGNRNNKAKQKIILSKGKKINQYTLDNIFIKQYSCISETGKYFKNRSNISACCRKKQTTAYGYKWSYAD